MVVLCINAGSSSLKLALFRVEGDHEEHVGSVADDGDPGALAALLGKMRDQGWPSPTAVGHRLVHGGTKHVAPERVDDRLVAALQELIPLAPNHLPAELVLLAQARAQFPALPQVVCFDTAFHRTLPAEAAHFPLPAELFDAGVQRFGFHGLSYEFVVGALAEKLRPRTIVAHLGSGSSMVALRDGVSVDTSMGLTPMGGLMMSTRSGDLDPGVLLYLLRERKLDREELSRLVASKAGLLGVSGTSADMKTLLRARADDPAADLAVRMFVRSAQKTIGSFAAILGGLDLLVFTGGVGEHAAAIRWEICAPLAHPRGGPGRAPEFCSRRPDQQRHDRRTNRSHRRGSNDCAPHGPPLELRTITAAAPARL